MYNFYALVVHAVCRPAGRIPFLQRKKKRMDSRGGARLVSGSRPRTRELAEQCRASGSRMRTAHVYFSAPRRQNSTGNFIPRSYQRRISRFIDSTRNYITYDDIS